ncbi:uncharacterized protein LOC133843265 [Drosophila sulfurigaster albostrigata]|uniref:uncharacterized protein LOC133843265 n=1 Tax=Drosophila sulfurigaster albostrigata TaxID=89887 RepID=UPI002D21C8EC|nr:uncharacterized protein LOC133843265 [Drosophila sulfurigaster albostrigata]
MDLSSEELQEFERAYHMIDKDGVGSFTSKDLGIFMRSLGMKPIEGDLQSMINEIDLDGNAGQIRGVFLELNTNLNDEEIDEILREADKDDDGVVSLEDFSKMMYTR